MIRFAPHTVAAVLVLSFQANASAKNSPSPSFAVAVTPYLQTTTATSGAQNLSKSEILKMRIEDLLDLPLEKVIEYANVAGLYKNIRAKQPSKARRNSSSKNPAGNTLRGLSREELLKLKVEDLLELPLEDIVQLTNILYGGTPQKKKTP